MGKDILNIERLSDFNDHKLVSFLFDNKTGLRGYIAIHRGNKKHPAFGATRMWEYDSGLEALRDALKLSRIMSYKAALAAPSYGGGKGVIMLGGGNASFQARSSMLKAFSERLNLLGGSFITGADVGLSKDDAALMRKNSPYIVGLKVDPVEFTVLGLYHSIKVALKEVFGTEDISGRKFAIKGVGKIGGGVLEKVYREGGIVFASDLDERRLKVIKNKFPKIEIVSLPEVHKLEVDVFSPNALSNCINSTIARELRCRIVLGGANIQLENDRAGIDLFKRGILYAPDYVVNAGGLISVVDEYETKRFSRPRIEKKVGKIAGRLVKIISLSKRKNTATNIIANQMAEKVFNSFD